MYIYIYTYISSEQCVVLLIRVPITQYSVQCYSYVYLQHSTVCSIIGTCTYNTVQCVVLLVRVPTTHYSVQCYWYVYL